MYLYFMLQPLPIGLQDFRQIREEGYLYVDKTEYIYPLIQRGKFYFLSRPRRFGKSLLIETLKHLFEGNQQLFQGLWIENKIEWKKHPVIHLTFNEMAFDSIGLENALQKKCYEIAANYGLSLSEETYDNCFRELIIKLSTKGKVVLLVDEYDKPIVDYLDNIPQAERNRKILSTFYGVIKPADEHLRFVFITGISKFSKISLFSKLNNLQDLTLHPKYTRLLGITQSELTHYFAGYITELTDKYTESKETILTWLKRYYNGYSWDGVYFVYNPFSLLNCFSEGEFEYYWFTTGTPTLLVKALVKNPLPAEPLEGMVVDSQFFTTFQLTNLDTYSLLFQTGYLTIKSVRRKGPVRYFTLGFPNNEVRTAFSHNLLEELTQKIPTNVNSYLMQINMGLQMGIPEKLIQGFTALFADISYHNHPRAQKDKSKLHAVWEGYFQSIIYLTFRFIGINVACEVTKHKGRIDVVAETDDYIFLLEFKLGTATEALAQIKEKHYAKSYQDTAKEVILMGIAFDKEERNIKEWLIERNA